MLPRVSEGRTQGQLWGSGCSEGATVGLKDGTPATSLQDMLSPPPTRP